MSLITDEKPPEGIDDRLSEYLNRMFRDARLSDDQHDQFIVRTRLPDKINEGKLYFFGQPIAGTPITIPGFYHYFNNDWYYIPDICTNGAWEDNTADLSAAKSVGAGAPLFYAINGGAKYPDISAINVILQTTHHILHRGKQGSEIVPHIHWTNDAALLAGQTVTFDFDIQIAAGHDQANFPAPTKYQASYTVPAGGRAQWRHIITEVADGSGFTMPEVDSVVLVNTYISANTLSGRVLGIYVDLHEEIERLSTKSKAPDFYT